MFIYVRRDGRHDTFKTEVTRQPHKNIINYTSYSLFRQSMPQNMRNKIMRAVSQILILICWNNPPKLLHYHHSWPRRCRRGPWTEASNRSCFQVALARAALPWERQDALTSWLQVSVLGVVKFLNFVSSPGPCFARCSVTSSGSLALDCISGKGTCCLRINTVLGYANRSLCIVKGKTDQKYCILFQNSLK